MSEAFPSTVPANIACAAIVVEVPTPQKTLQASKRAEKARLDDLRLVKIRVKYGESSLQNQLQAEQSLYQVSENIPLVRQSIAQTENALAVLAGDYPHDIARGQPLEQQIEMQALPPAGVPSELLARRPDIRQADDTLVAADADRRRSQIAAPRIHARWSGPLIRCDNAYGNGRHRGRQDT